MSDNFSNDKVQLTSPAIDGFFITPNNNADLVETTRGLYVGVAGDVVCEMQRGNEVVYRGLLAGVVYPFRIRRVRQTSQGSPQGVTTAGDLVGLV
jgi:hypothetical protein